MNKQQGSVAVQQAAQQQQAQQQQQQQMEQVEMSHDGNQQMQQGAQVRLKILKASREKGLFFFGEEEREKKIG